MRIISTISESVDVWAPVGDLDEWAIFRQGAIESAVVGENGDRRTRRSG